MTRISDRDEIRRLLNTDRVWSIYALADLDPYLWDLCQWWTTGQGLALVFNGISIRPIFVLGPKQDVDDLLQALPVVEGYLNIRDEHTPLETYKFTHPHRMRRMVIENLNERAGDTVLLGPENVQEIEQLYATGTGAGVAFGGFQLESGYFRGIRHNGDLIAVAGVHVVSQAESVAGVGNIFTRQDQRGLGLAQIVTSAVTKALLIAGIQTIGLNVEDDNAAAIKAYENLGYRTALEYYEGTAVRK